MGPKTENSKKVKSKKKVKKILYISKKLCTCPETEYFRVINFKDVMI